AILMLRHLNERAAADKVEGAMLRVFEEGKVRTRDIGGTATTDEFADAIIGKMNSLRFEHENGVSCRSLIKGAVV
ncbi:MAG TPA: isocitrate/isopropylmalate family dehydrogenase, partial [Pyrinomonadaceae bacterium]|nr:isocitrate/isopropylmalate family dehydrogenase [Pyrinomonadaceae bacterium]